MSSVDNQNVRTPEITMICACAAIMFFVFAFVFSAIDTDQINGMAKMRIEYRLFPPMIVGVILLVAGGLISATEIVSAITKTVLETITKPGMP